MEVLPDVSRHVFVPRLDSIGAREEKRSSSFSRLCQCTDSFSRFSRYVYLMDDMYRRASEREKDQRAVGVSMNDK